MFRRGVWIARVMIWMSWLFKGVPLLPLYTRGAGLHDGVLVGYGIGVLVGYNCASCIQGRSDSIPTPIEASCSLAQQVVHVYPVWSRWPGLPSVQVTVLGRRMDTRGDILHTGCSGFSRAFVRMSC